MDDLINFDGLNIELLDFDFSEVEPAQKEVKGGCAACLDGSVNSRVLKRETRHEYRRAFSESRLLDMLERDFTPGATYHCISGGDIDSLSYLKHIVRQQDLHYLLFSTWCMASDDVLQFREWIERGNIARLDAYCGEIFPGSYSKEHRRLKEVVNLCAGRVAIFEIMPKYTLVSAKNSPSPSKAAPISTRTRGPKTPPSPSAVIFLSSTRIFLTASKVTTVITTAGNPGWQNESD